MIHDPRIYAAIEAFYADTLRTLGPYPNGGRTLRMEGGSQPFIEMLNRSEAVVMVGDSPASWCSVMPHPLFARLRADSWFDGKWKDRIGPYPSLCQRYRPSEEAQPGMIPNVCGERSGAPRTSAAALRQ